MLHFFTVAVPEAFVGLHRTKTSKDLRSKLTTVRSKASKSESSGLVQTSAWHPFKIYGSVSVRHFSTTAVPAQSGAQIAETANLSFDKSLSITMYSDLSLGLVHTSQAKEDHVVGNERMHSQIILSTNDYVFLFGHLQRLEALKI